MAVAQAGAVTVYGEASRLIGINPKPTQSAGHRGAAWPRAVDRAGRSGATTVLQEIAEGHCVRTVSNKAFLLQLEMDLALSGFSMYRNIQLKKHTLHPLPTAFSNC